MTMDKWNSFRKSFVIRFDQTVQTRTYHFLIGTGLLGAGIMVLINWRKDNESLSASNSRHAAIIYHINRVSNSLDETKKILDKQSKKIDLIRSLSSARAQTSVAAASVSGWRIWGGDRDQAIRIELGLWGISNEDIKVLFSEVGDLKHHSIHYDRSGKSQGTAEVEFLRQSDALAAVKRYNNVQRDGKPMKIELVGVNLVTTAVVPPTSKGILGNPVFRSIQERGNTRGPGPAGWQQPWSWKGLWTRERPW